MTCFVDTSVLLSLAGTDAHSPTAKRWWQNLSGPLVTTALVIFETENRLRSMRLLKADTLATIDKNQRALAKSAGLKVAP
jgi:predicted nucleic acid-binding protein